MRISWVTGSDNLQFLNQLIEEGEIETFQHPHIVAMVDYLWSIARPYFINHIFLQFFILNFLTVIIISFTSYALHWSIDNNWIVFIINTLCLLALTYGNFRAIYYEGLELYKTGTSYFLSAINYFQLALIVSTFVVVLMSYRSEIARLARVNSDNPVSWSEGEVDAY